jgi:hypothetical protein
LGNALCVDAHLHSFVKLRGKVLPNIVRPNGKFAVASVYENRQLNTLRAAKSKQSVDGGSYCAASIEDVIHQNHNLARDIFGKLRGKQFAHCALGKIITMESRFY